MISLIICSRTSILNEGLTTNIEKTIGVPYEIVLIDNSANKYGICEAYNLGVEKSRYLILCFMHDDIIYQSANWGESVANHLKDEQTGAIGVVGTSYISYMPGAWWGSGNLYEHLLQSSTPEDEPLLKSNINGKRQEVAAFDGVWFCVKRKLFGQIKFDEETFKGFHLYDIDICMQLFNKGYQLYCINNITIHHTSMGSVNSTWIENALIFHKKWKKKLPATCKKWNYKTLCGFEFKTLNNLIWICYANNWPNRKTYALAVKSLFEFKKGYGYYKTPGYLIKFVFKYLFKKGAPFYSF